MADNPLTVNANTTRASCWDIKARHFGIVLQLSGTVLVDIPQSKYVGGRSAELTFVPPDVDEPAHKVSQGVTGAGGVTGRHGWSQLWPQFSRGGQTRGDVTAGHVRVLA